MSSVGATLRAVLRHPASVPSAVRSAIAMAPRGWWRRPPYLPVPDGAYWRFRLETSSGGDGTVEPSPQEVAEVIAWTRRMRRMRRGGER